MKQGQPKKPYIKKLLPQQKTFSFLIKDQDTVYFGQTGPVNRKKVIITSHFDSGNCLNVVQETDSKVNFPITPFATLQYIVYTCKDCTGRKKEGTHRSWFYFSFKGFPVGQKLLFVIRSINILFSFVS